MALIIFPAPNSDSFVTLPQAELYISTLTLNGNEWKALTPEVQEQLLRIAYRDIIDHTDPTTYPQPLPVCVAEANALMAIHDSVNNLSGGATVTATKGALKKQKVGTLEQQFYDVQGAVANKSTSRIPAMAKNCLDGLGYKFKSHTAGLKQAILGRS